MIKRGGRCLSGGFSGYTGWFNVFFPLISKQFNRFCAPYSASADYALAGLRESWTGMLATLHRQGDEGDVKGKQFGVSKLLALGIKAKQFGVMPSEDYPDGTDKVPMTWAYYDLEFPMEFVSGFVGYTMDADTKAVTPVLSWYLLDKTPEVKVQDADLGDQNAILEKLRCQ